MLLFSTKFPVKDELTKQKFVEMVIQWNQESPHDKMEGISWDENSYNIKFQDGKRTLAIEELRDKNVIATRFRKEDENGVVWTTDFILNLEDKIIAICLDRETTEDTTSFIPRFSPPHFVKRILKNKYSGYDGNLLISEQPHVINLDNYKIVEDIILRKVKYTLPIVYVTKSWAGNYPLNVKTLALKLQGVAHVLKEVDPNVSKVLMKNCNGENVHHGGIGIYYPSISATNKKINGQGYWEKGEEILVRKIVNIIFRYANQQRRESMYTWEGIQNEILRLKNESLLNKRRAVEDENQEIVNVFDELIKEQEETIKELNNKVAALTQENQGLRFKMDAMDELPILFMGEEEDLYDGEIKEMILDILSESLNKQKNNSRRAHILKDIIDNNNYEGVVEKRKNEIKNILKGYSNMPSSMKQSLQKFGFCISADGKHYKLSYYNDSRYTFIMAKSGSDGRGGSNLASEIIKDIL